jgi:hypothetical protein
MNAFWSYFWPCFAVGVVVGVVVGVIGFRRPRPVSKGTLADAAPLPPASGRKRFIVLGAGVALSLGATGIWSGPAGAADRFVSTVERQAREALDYYEMSKVTAHLHRGPLTRRLVLAGPADDFQTEELIRLMSELPGVSRAQWARSPAGPPLIVEGLTVTVVGFLLGLLLAYLIELHRRHNAQWNW